VVATSRDTRRQAGPMQEFDASSDAPFGRTGEGRDDYRGANLQSAKLENALIERADFSRTNFQHLRATSCRFVDCVFDHANLADANFRTCEFIECRFRKTDLRMAGLGVGGGLFDRCTFDGIRKRYMSFINPVFRGVTFRGKDWSHLDFSASGLWDCAFVGDVRDIMFRGDFLVTEFMHEVNGPPRDTGLHGVNFADAELFLLGFTHNCALDDIVLPKSGTAFLCKSKDLYASEPWLKTITRGDILMGLQGYIKMVRDYDSGSTQPRWIVSKHDIVTWTEHEQEGARLYDLLKERLVLRKAADAD